MRRRRRNELLEEPVINLTPLIDVVFVILFTFIVVAPLLEIDKVELASSGEQCGHTGAETKSPIAIHVFQDDSIAFNQEEIGFQELECRLEEAKMKFPNAVPQLFHDKKGSFGTYQSIKNAVENAGFTQMDVLLKP